MGLFGGEKKKAAPAKSAVAMDEHQRVLAEISKQRRQIQQLDFKNRHLTEEAAQLREDTKNEVMAAAAVAAVSVCVGAFALMRGGGGGQAGRQSKNALEALSKQHAEEKGLYIQQVQDIKFRADKDIATAKQFSGQKFAKSLLDTSDNLDRAIEALPREPEEGSPLHAMAQGLRFTQAGLLGALNAHGVEKLASLHQPFDPNFCEAMMQVPTAAHAPGTVVSVMQAGFTLHGRILRPARVGVSAAPPPTAAEVAEAAAAAVAAAADADVDAAGAAGAAEAEAGAAAGARRGSAGAGAQGGYRVFRTLDRSAA
jgi:molecular chaperone GrpE